MALISKNSLNNENLQICPECHGKIISNDFENVCQECGLVTNLLKLSNHYQINETDMQSNSGTQYVSIGKTVDNLCALGSHIDYFSKFTFLDYRKQLLPAKYQKLFKKLKKYYSLPSKIKNHETDFRILKILSNVSEYLNLSVVVKSRAAYLYHEIKRRSNCIKNHVSLIGFCIFQASKEEGHTCPVSIREICKIFTILGHRISPKLIIRDNMEYHQFLSKKIDPHRSEDFIPRFVDGVVNSPLVQQRMKIKKSTWHKEEYRQLLRKKCENILKKLTFRDRGSRNPFILAAAVVYCSDKLLAIENGTKFILTQSIASKAMNIPEYSIRDHYVKILKPFFSL